MISKYWNKILTEVTGGKEQPKDNCVIVTDKRKKPIRKLSYVELNGISFTNREMDCLNLLLEEKNKAKDIALKLNLKQKSVEDYFRKIRKKTGCNKKMLIEFMKQGAITKRTTGSDCKSGG